MKKEKFKKLTREELKEKLEEDQRVAKEKIDYLMTLELLDDDGYPTDAAHDIVEIWHWMDAKGWFEFIKSIWWARDWGWTEGEEPHEWDKDKIVYRYNISTGGWSGNESIIRAMEANGNGFIWHLNWVQSRRGGHYIFELKEFESD